MYKLINVICASLLFVTSNVFASPIAKDALKIHNQIRALDKQKPLVWNKELQKISQDWANKLASTCEIYHHSGQTSFGENLYYYSESTTIKKVVKDWASERDFYDYQKNSCQTGQQCGHYKQVVWKDTTDVGCGVQSCADGSQIWVCAYFPAGNIIGERPF